MAKILFFYAINEYPTRNTIKELLESFQSYSEHKIYYYNFFKDRIPNYLRQIKFDMIIFHQTVTLCGNKEAYLSMIKMLKAFCLESNAKKIALFQDEYFYSNMLVAFINKLQLDYIFSVAPREEWKQIYKGIRKECKICPMLTGYISLKPPEYYASVLEKERTKDVGYRVAWDKQSIVLGKFGYDKLRIAKLFLRELNKKGFRLDIKVGSRYFIKGKKWNDFLSSCRFVLGAESGSGVLDRDGSIRERVLKEIQKNPEITALELYNKFVKEYDGNFNLRAISPRHFEAIEEGACQILYEGAYSGILKPYVHYIPLKKDHSNFEEIIKLMKDETERKRIVLQAFQDIVESQKYTYKSFVKYFFDTVWEKEYYQKEQINIVENVVYYVVKLHEIRIRICTAFISFLKSRGILKWMQKNPVTKIVLDYYYAFRH